MKQEIEMPSISIIIPVYKAEKYIAKCTKSLFEQTLKSIEYIFIDDCSPDDSIEIVKSILKEYPERTDFVKIEHMPINSKQAAARNRGLELATGEYIIHCDPDDWIDVDYYEKLYNRAKSGNYDIVVGNYSTFTEDNETMHNLRVDFSTPQEVLFSSTFVFFSLWTHLVRASIIKENGLTFFKGINFMEDRGFLMRAIYFAKSISFISCPFYHYRKDNPNSITGIMNSEPIIEQRIECLRLLDNFFHDHNINITKLLTLMREKRDIKDYYLSQGNYSRWRRLFPEVNKYEYKYSQASLLYRVIYLSSSYLGYWPMKYYKKLRSMFI